MFPPSEAHSLRARSDRGDRWVESGQEDAESKLNALRRELNLAVLRSRELSAALDRSDAVIRRKNMLLREIDHRVKTNLQVAMSLLRLQAKHRSTPEVSDFVDTACARLGAVAAIHELLYQTHHVGTVDLGLYLRKICTSLRLALDADGRRTLGLDAQSVKMAWGTAQALGIVVNELVANAFRHAFAPNAPGAVLVRAARERNGAVTLSVSDNGKGLPEGFTIPAGKGLGLRLVAMTAKEIGARLDLAGQDGARFTLSLPRPPADARPDTSPCNSLNPGDFA